MRIPFLIALLASSFFASRGLAHAAQSAPHGSFSTESLRVRTHRGLETFRIARPGAPESDAERENPDLADASGSVPPNTPGYRLTNRIVVRSDDAAHVRSLRRSHPSVAVEALADVPGFWIVEARSVRDAIALTEALAGDERLGEAYLDIASPRQLHGLNDPGLSKQWHLHNTQLPVADINLLDAWLAGFKGAGVTVGIVEDAWQTNHPDLAANFNSAASQSFGVVTDHATSCAGLVAAVANNGRCGIGVASAAKISKLLFGSSSQNAAAFGFRNNLNAIKSNSWGAVGQISSLSSVERSSIDNAVATGRGGRGTIFVFAAGNGGPQQRCDYDGYPSNRKVVSVGAIGDQDTRAVYNEQGSSMLVVAPSDGNARSIYTTTVGNACTGLFGGTSAACPIAAGVIALMLEANPNLTWRDVQHILIHTARKCDPMNGQWIVNGGGHDVNYHYGFGAIDASAAVALAFGWTGVAPETSFTTGVVNVNKAIPQQNATGVTELVDVPTDIRVESVELVLNVATANVGDLRIVLTSPSGTQSLFAEPRVDPTDNYANYVFTSRRHFDETSAGTWSIRIADSTPQFAATWTNFRLNIHGTP